MKMVGFDHLTINVTDLEKSKFFYENVLELEYCGFIDMGDHTLTYYMLPQGVRLELIDYENKDTAVPVPETHVGMYRHFCLVVDSLAELTENCRKHNVFIRKEAGWVERLEKNNMLIVDPNGVEIEVFEAEA